MATAAGSRERSRSRENLQDIAAARDAAALDPAILQLLAQQHQLDPATLQLLASQQADPLLAQGLQQSQLDQAEMQAADKQKVLDQISMQQQMLKQAEEEAKQQAAKAGGYVGILARFDDMKGYGFIECSESRSQYGRDIFLLRRKMNGAEVGDIVSFTVEMGDQGKPQATNVSKLLELSQHKKMILMWQQMYTGAVVDASSGVPVVGTIKEFTGVVGKWDAEKGWGFIECTETYALYQRNVFIHKDHWIPGMRAGGSAPAKGDVVRFHVELNSKGWPQARNVFQKQVLGGALASGGGAFTGIGLSGSGGLAAFSAPSAASAVSSAALAQEGILSAMIGQDPALTVEDQTSLMAFFGRLSVTSVAEIQELGEVTNLQKLIGKELYAHEQGRPMSMPAKTALGRILLQATGAD